MTSTGITNATAGISPSTSFLSPVFHLQTDKPNLPEGRRARRAPQHKSPVPPTMSKQGLPAVRPSEAGATALLQQEVQHHGPTVQPELQPEPQPEPPAFPGSPALPRLAGCWQPVPWLGPCPAPRSSAALPAAPGKRLQGPPWSLGMVSPLRPGTSSLLVLPPPVHHPGPTASENLSRVGRPGPAPAPRHLPTPAPSPAHQPWHSLRLPHPGRDGQHCCSVTRCHGSVVPQPPATGALKQLQETDNCSGLSYFAFTCWQRAITHPLLQLG